MKVAIVTLVGDFNYGNRLQNYALQEVLTSMGAEVFTIDNPPRAVSTCIKEYLFERVGGKRHLKHIGDLCREKNLRKFTKQYIHMNESNFTNGDYDYFVVGSDQVWNPSFWGTNTECYWTQRYLLQDVEPQKRVAYAASFGIEQLNDIWNPVFRKELSQFHAISVRETSGADIVKNVCGKVAEVVLDPTLLLPSERWQQMAVQMQEEPYVLAFFLGEISQQKKEYMEKISCERGYRIIDMTSRKDTYYHCDPEVFLGLIKNAEMVFTDSFHVTVFSIIFHTPFLSLTREQRNYCKMSSRLETLLNMVHMTDRFNNMDIEDPFTCTFDGVNPIIESRRKDSVHFLQNALKL